MIIVILPPIDTCSRTNLFRSTENCRIVHPHVHARSRLVTTFATCISRAVSIFLYYALTIYNFWNGVLMTSYGNTMPWCRLAAAALLLYNTLQYCTCDLAYERTGLCNFGEWGSTTVTTAVIDIAIHHGPPSHERVRERSYRGSSRAVRGFRSPSARGTVHTKHVHVSFNLN